MQNTFPIMVCKRNCVIIVALNNYTLTKTDLTKFHVKVNFSDFYCIFWLVLFWTMRLNLLKITFTIFSIILGSIHYYTNRSQTSPIIYCDHRLRVFAGRTECVFNLSLPLNVSAARGPACKNTNYTETASQNPMWHKEEQLPCLWTLCKSSTCWVKKFTEKLNCFISRMVQSAQNFHSFVLFSSKLFSIFFLARWLEGTWTDVWCD